MPSFRWDWRRRQRLLSGLVTASSVRIGDGYRAGDSSKNSPGNGFTFQNSENFLTCRNSDLNIIRSFLFVFRAVMSRS